MSDIPSDTIESPCIKLCVVDSDSELCIGCGRTRQEIGGWVSFSSDERRAIIDTLPERLENITKRRRRRGGARSRRQTNLVD